MTYPYPLILTLTLTLQACGSTMDAGMSHVLITTVFILTTASIALAISDLGLVLSVVRCVRVRLRVWVRASVISKP